MALSVSGSDTLGWPGERVWRTSGADSSQRTAMHGSIQAVGSGSHTAVIPSMVWCKPYSGVSP